MRIEQPDPDDCSDDAPAARDDPDAADKARGKEVDGDSPLGLPDASPDSALRVARRLAYRAVVEAAYRQYDIEHGRLAETVVPPGEVLRVPGGDLPDDPRNHSNPKTGRVDASWSAYDRAIAAAREHAGGDLGPDSVKMFDYNPETGEGTGTLIGEQTPGRLRGWRIDGRDGHVNWWDWTGGKKGAGGAYGHDWFPEDLSAPGSRYIGWAPWQDSNGNILEGT